MENNNYNRDYFVAYGSKLWIGHLALDHHGDDYDCFNLWSGGSYYILYSNQWPKSLWFKEIEWPKNPNLKESSKSPETE